MIPSQNCDQPTSKRALEICDIRSISSSSSSNLRGRHLSKSASELSCSPRCEEMTEIRPRSAAPPEHTHISVYQKAHSFFAQLKNRWGHGKHRERRHKSPGRQDSTTDYAADQSSDHSTPSTQSPRHRLHQTACTDSPLSRVCVGDTPHSSPGGSPRPRAPTPGAVAGLDLIPVTSSDDVVRRRETALRQHSFFQLRIHLRRGHGLVAMDKNGTSDPYVKFKLGGRLVYKSRTVYRDLNPTWDESFTVPIEDPFIPLQIKVFDYDWGLQDDFMGSCQLELTSLELGRMMDISISLQDPSKVGASLGEISLTVTLYPKTQEDKEQIYDDKMFDLTSTSRIRRKIKTKVVTFGNRIQSSKVFGSFQDLSILDKDKIRERVRKFKCSSSDIDDYDSDDGNRNVVLDGRSLSISQFAIKSRLTLDVVRDAGDEDRTDVTGATDKNLLGRLGDRCQNQFQRMKFLLYPTPIYADTSQNWTNNFFTYCEDYGIDSDVESIEYCDAIKRYEQYEQVIPILYNPPVPSFISGDYDPYFQKTTKVSDVNKRLKSQIWSSVVTIVVIEGKNLLACDPETGTSDPYVKFRLGNEKYKTRVIWRSLNPRWLEQFDLHLYDDGDQQLEITVWDKDRSRDDFIGRTSIDLSSLEREKTHSIWARLEDAAGTLNLLLTISGTTASETISDLTSHEDNPMEKEILLNRYAWHRTFHNIKDVGHLTVKVFRATGLAAADLGGKSDPFCVLELGNARLQTQTEYKTLSPSWQKIFTFNVKDINNVLDVTVYDEDRDHKVEFLGKIAIPLLRIKNGEKRWYALKDKKLRSRAKGSSPQILLEMSVIWNPIRACIRTLNPKEEKYMQTEIKFKRQVFVKNVLRLKVIVMHFYEYGKILQSCFEWESTFQSFVALVFFLILCYYFEPWMIPIAGLLIFLKQYIVKQITGPQTVPWDEVADSDLDDDEEDDKEKEEKKSLKERLQAIQEVTQGVQNAIGRLATFGESVKNTFNFTVPYLSWIAVFLLVATCLVLYFIPIRYLLMLWGMNKFFRRILRPHSVPNNELLDLVSRVPDNEMLLDYKDLKILLATEPEKRREPRKKHKVS